MDPLALIRARAEALLASLPPGVTLVAAGKTRTPAEIAAAVDAGVTAIGHNYVQEAEASIEAIGRRVRWHLIGHLQRNKARRAAELFDVIEVVDSLRLAQALSQAALGLGRTLPILIEVNAALEEQKAGVPPGAVEELVHGLAGIPHLRVEGLMTMGPLRDDPEENRPFFRETRRLFERLQAARIPGIAMTTLSMGMSDSYQVAIEEGATEVRIGTALFGPRHR